MPGLRRRGHRGSRLRPGVTLEQANASLAAVSRPILHAASDDAEFIGEEEKGHFRFAAELVPVGLQMPASCFAGHCWPCLPCAPAFCCWRV